MGNRMTQLLSDKEGLVVEGQLDFGVVPMGESQTMSLVVRNTSDKAHIFRTCSCVRADPQYEIELPIDGKLQSSENGVPMLSSDMELQPQGVGCIFVKFNAKSLGRVKQLIVLKFSSCEIGRYIASNVVDNYQARLAPMAPYQRNRAKGREAWDRFMESGSKERWVIPGERPTRKTKIIFPIRLKLYNIPSDVRRCIVQQIDLSTVVPVLHEPLTMDNHSARFSALLNAEELQMELDMREFDLQNVTMDLCGEFLSLHVPGLAEGRPSLLIGDTVAVMLCDGSNDAPSYEGYIHEVRKDDVLLKFHEDFHNNFGLQPCDVIFYFNRSSIRRAHQAVEFAAQLGAEVVFPRKLESKLPIVNLVLQSDDGPPPSDQQTSQLNNEDKEKASQLISDKTQQSTHNVKEKSTVKKADFMYSKDQEKASQLVSEKKQQPTRSNAKEKPTAKKVDFLYNSNLNERQRAAVCRIASGQCRPTPYILFGPPGTGKTVTLVEAILQVFHRIPSSRIIACAPSNSAADLLATRLHGSGFVQEGDMVRLNAFQRGQEIPESIAPYCLDTDSLVLAAHYRIIVSTCSTSGQLFSLGLRAGHFTHVFIDEAGQATEPECLVPMGLAAGGEGQIILAGDPHQLGPVLRSPVAKGYGLNMSLLERLMSRPLYTRDEARFVDHGCYDPLLVTKLVNNYRSHPSLLHLPSALFYHGELKVFADQKMRESLSKFDMLAKKGVPLVFHGIKGDDLREGSSPSWFNPAEAVQAVRYIQGLKNSPTISVKSTDIGVVTPYKKQVEKIRLLLRSVSVEDIKVGSVEEFQGQERPVIIISTVRSDQSHVASDVTHSIGFLINPKRFNVAITRAQCLLIVIGNPHVLCQDPYWCSLLHYCVMNDVYTGCDLPDLNYDLYQEEFHFALEVLNRIVDKEQADKDHSTKKENPPQCKLQSNGDSPSSDTINSKSVTNEVTDSHLHDDKTITSKCLTNNVKNIEHHDNKTSRSDFQAIANDADDLYCHGNDFQKNLPSESRHQGNLIKSSDGNDSLGSRDESDSHSSCDDKGTKQSIKLDYHGDDINLENATSDVGDLNRLDLLDNHQQRDTSILMKEGKPLNEGIGVNQCKHKVDDEQSDSTYASETTLLQSESCSSVSQDIVNTEPELKPTVSYPQAFLASTGEDWGECYHGNNDVQVNKETTTKRPSDDGLKMFMGVQIDKSDGLHSNFQDKVSNLPDRDLRENTTSSPHVGAIGFHGNTGEMTSELSSEHLKQLLGIAPSVTVKSCPSDDRECEARTEDKQKEKTSAKNGSKDETRTRRSSDKAHRLSNEKSRNCPRRTRKRTKSEPPSALNETRSCSMDGLPVVNSREKSADRTSLTSKKRTFSVGLPVELKGCEEDGDDDDLEEFLFQPATGH